MVLLRLFAITTCATLTLAACAGETPESEVSDEEVAATNDPLYADFKSIWPTRNVPVCWENPQDSTAMGWVRDAVTTSWATASPLNFTGWGTCGSDPKAVRIKVDDVQPWSCVGPNNTPCTGPDNRLAPTTTMWLNFSFRNWDPSCASSRERCIRVIAVHEFGHALGFVHEQRRPDTPTTCNTDEVRQPITNGIVLGGYDPDSVMNYCNPTWNNNGILSTRDVLGVRSVYGKPATAPADDDARVFNASDYLALYGDLSAAFGTNTASARSHWFDYGLAEGRDGSVLFSVRYYMQNNADLRSVYGPSNWLAGLEHFLKYGVNEGRRPSIFFDATYYLAQNADLRNAYGTNKSAAFNHWVTYGINEGRRASPEFDPKYYLAVNTDVAKAYGATNYRGALIHYSRYGKSEGRRCVP